MPDLLLHLPPSARDAAYDNTAAVPDAGRQLADFDTRSAALVGSVPVHRDLRYGAAERQTFDGFPGREGMPTLLFIHGGYWQMRHKNTFRFVLEGALAKGLHGALIGYTLAPEAGLSRIVDEVRDGIAAVRTHALGEGGSGEILLCGWSAGAHLAAMTLGCDGVTAGLGLSGIYDLAPLRNTRLNEALRLTDEEVAGLSPLNLPQVDKPFVIAYGTGELPQLQAQSRAFARHRAHCRGGVWPVGEADHFSILQALASADGALLAALSAAGVPAAEHTPAGG